jgi:glycosyltransferase involved in cell wall biosynthesis
VTEPLISIVLPTYCGSRYLEKSVDSCLRQTLHDFELILVDDGSSDDTPQVIRELSNKDPRIRTIFCAQNRGLPAALNIGFSQSKGSYLTWTSDDNLYRPHALSTMMTYLSTRRDVQFVYTDFTEIDHEGQAIRQRVVPEFEDLIDGNRIGPCFLYRRFVLDKIGGYAEDLYLAEDYDYWLRMAIHYEMKPLHEDCYLYRLHPASLSTRERRRVITVMAFAVLRHLDNIDWVRDEYKCTVCLRSASIFLNAGLFEEAATTLAKAINRYDMSDCQLAKAIPLFLYQSETPMPEQFLSVEASGFALSTPIRQLLDAGRVDEAAAAMREQDSSHPDRGSFRRSKLGYAVNRTPTRAQLRDETELRSMLALLPWKSAKLRRLRRRVWGEYLGVRCFDTLARGGLSNADTRRLRRDFVTAVINHPQWLRNRGMLRLGVSLVTGVQWRRDGEESPGSSP